MEKVYLSKEIEKIVGEIDCSILGENVAIKLHFGERGCVTFLKPDLVRAVYDRVVSSGRKATLIECNVLYRGSRTNTTEHIKTAKEHGFGFAPIDILDGENGQEFVQVFLDKGLVKNAKLGKGLIKYDSIIVLTHFTGHEAAGLAGAFKNLGMGLGSRAGKLHMHSDIKPSIDPKKCIGCGICLENCNANAIELNKKANRKAKINHKRCEGCAMCIAVCPEKAVKIPWHGSTSKQLQKKIVDYAEAVMKLMKSKIVFVNVLENITADCDCLRTVQEPIMDDIGILMANDIVAVDKASLDLANKYSHGKFGKISSADKSIQADYAFKKGLGCKDYEIVDLDK